MKKLVLTALLAAGLSQAAGCIITSDDTGDDVGSDPRIIADITLSNQGPNPLICFDDPNDPKGQDGLRVNARLTGTQSGFSDVYNCTTRALITPPLTSGAGTYDIWVDYINDRGFPNDPTQWVIVDYTDPVTVSVPRDTDVHAIVDLAIGNGFLDTQWTIEPVAAGCPPGGTVTVDSTLQGPSTLFDDEYLCEDGLAPLAVFSEEAMPLGDYVVATQLFADGNPVTSAGDANLTILDGNDYETVDITFTVN